MSVEDGLVMQLPRGLLPQPQPAGLRALRPPTRARHPDRRASGCATSSHCSTATATTRADADPLHAGRDHLLRASWRRWPATIRRSSSVRPGGSTTASTACARYFDQVMETAGLYNTAGFNDDTRAFPSIPPGTTCGAGRRANWLAGLVVRGWRCIPDSIVQATARRTSWRATRRPETMCWAWWAAAGLEGAERPAGLLLCPLTPANAAALRGTAALAAARFRWGCAPSAGMGDRLGLATPGHVRAVRGATASRRSSPSSRSARTPARGRSPQAGAGRRHVGRVPGGLARALGRRRRPPQDTDDIDRAFVAAGYTFFTIDPGDHVDE
jgi:hypothetical protein